MLFIFKLVLFVREVKTLKLSFDFDFLKAKLFLLNLSTILSPKRIIVK